MKYILVLVCLLVPLHSYAGCGELKTAVLNLEKAIEQQSSIIVGLMNDTSISADIKRTKARKEIGELIELRKTLSEQQCNQGGKDVPLSAVKPSAESPAPARPEAPSKFIKEDKGSGKKFKPAGKMY